MIDAITDADLVIVPPSNPVVSVGTILGVPRIREALVATRAQVVGVSPIIGGHHVHGMAEQLLDRHRRRGERGCRRPPLRRRAPGRGSSTAGWSTSRTPATLEALRAAGLGAAAVPLFMTDDDATAAIAAAAITLVTG